MPLTDKKHIKYDRGRKSRWKIENYGFNIQKNGTFNIGILYNKNAIAIKIHYILIQMTHIIRQLLVKVSKELNLIIKEISLVITHELISIKLPNIEIFSKIQLRFDE